MVNCTYRGYFYDVETGLYFLKSRYYDPETGRFISPDGIEYADPETINGLNLYAYCGNNPVMNVDPDGHFWWLFLIGLAVGAFSYTADKIVEYVFTGSWSWSLGEFLGTTFTFALFFPIAGALSPAVAAFTMGAATDVGAKIGSILIDGKKYSFSEIMLSAIKNGVVSLVSAGIMSQFKLPMVNSGRNSFSSISKQIITKTFNKSIKRISFKTIFKMMVNSLYEGFLEPFLRHWQRRDLVITG